MRRLFRLLLVVAIAAALAAGGLFGFRYWVHGESPRAVADRLLAAPQPPSWDSPDAGPRRPADQPEFRVLFIGNSLTYSAGMPQMVERLAWADGINLRAEQHAPGGSFLAQHAVGAVPLSKIRAGGWNAVVLQEQSLVPALNEPEVDARMLPAVRTLAGEVRRSNAGATVLLYQTFAYRDGDAERARTVSPELATYPAMQARISATYNRAAADVGATLAPVGRAWARVRAMRPDLDLYFDNVHPNKTGAYLVASVFYATLTGRSPVENTFTGGVDAETARFLRGIAGDAVRASR